MAKNVKKVIKSMRGKEVDFDRMRLENASQTALGNASMNAKGDIIDKSGKIVVSRETLIQQYRNEKSDVVNSVSLKPAEPDIFISPKQALKQIEEDIVEKKTTRRKIIDEDFE